MTAENTATEIATPPAATFKGGSPTIGKLAGALAAAQKEIKQPEKTKTARIPIKTNGSHQGAFYSYRYCDIADVLAAALPALGDHGLALLQFPSDRDATGPNGPQILVSVRSVLVHDSGEWVENEITATADSRGVQSIGSAITYLRRYGGQMLLGIAAEEDDDGEAGHGEQPGGAHGNAKEKNQASGTFQDVIEEITETPKGNATLHQVRTKGHGVLETFKTEIVNALRPYIGTPQLVTFEAEATQYGSRLLRAGVDTEAAKPAAVNGHGKPGEDMTEADARIFKGAPPADDGSAYQWIKAGLEGFTSTREVVILKNGCAKRKGEYWTEATKKMIQAAYDHHKAAETAQPAAAVAGKGGAT